MGLPKITRFIVGVVLALAVLEIPQLLSNTTSVTSALANFTFANNFHSVSPGRFYRSGQMSHEELQETISRYRIRTVIDLRLSKDRPDSSGMTEEQAAAALNAAYLKIPLNGARIPSLIRMEQLLGAYDSAELPILVHCSSGTHRAGFATAVWLMAKEGVLPEVAQEQFAARFGYFGLERKLKAFVVGRPTIDRFLHWYVSEYEKSPVGFRQWLDGLNAEFDRWLFI